MLWVRQQPWPVSHLFPLGLLPSFFPVLFLGFLSGAKNRAVSDPTQSEKRKASGEHPRRGQAAFFFRDNDKRAREFPKNRENKFLAAFRIFSFRESTVCRHWPKRQISHQIRRIMLTTMGAKHPISREWARGTQRGIGKERIGSGALAHTVTREHLILIFCPFAALYGDTCPTVYWGEGKGADVNVRTRRKNSPISFPFYPRRPPPL